MEDKKNKKKERVIFGFTYFQFGMIVALIVFMIFLQKSTTPIPNYQNGTILYGQDSLVPPTYISGTQLFVEILLLVGIILSFIRKEGEKAKRIDITEAKKLMSDYLQSIEEITTKSGMIVKLGNWNIDEHFLVRYILEKGERKANEYVLQINIQSEGTPKLYVKGYVHAYEKFIDGFVEIDAPLEDKDKCPECGKEYDEKIILPDEIKALKMLKEGLKD